MSAEAAEWKRSRIAVWAGLVVAALAALAVYGYFALASKPAGEGYGRFAKGAMAKLTVASPPAAQPTGTFTDAAGAERRLSYFHGQVVLLNVWATWCGPCVHELPTLAGLQRRFEGRGMKVLPISVDGTSNRANAEAMLKERGAGALDFFIDPSRAMAFATGSPGLPTTILYDRQGKELARLSGGADWDSPEAVALIEAALAGPSVHE